MMASISELNNVAPTEPVDLGEIAPARKPRFPRQGIYTFRVPDNLDPAFTFGTTQAGYRSVEIDPTIVGPENAGYQVRFQKLSAKTFKETDKNTGAVRTTSQVARFLAACGVQGTLATDDDLINAVMSTQGKEFRAVLDWRAYNKRTGQEVEGMKNFPTFANGDPQPWIEDPDDLVESTKNPGTMIPKRYSARAFISRYLPKN